MPPTFRKESPKEKPIPVEEVRKRGVLGDLGHPLGEFVTIEGVVADENYRKLKADSGETLLRVQAVDGSELKSEVVFHFSAFNGKDTAEKPKVDAKFKYIGYESGGYYGVVDGLHKYTTPPASVGYYFHTHFTIVKDELKAK